MAQDKKVINDIEEIVKWDHKKKDAFLDRLLVHKKSGCNGDEAIQQAYLDTYSLPDDHSLGGGIYKSNLG